MSRFAAALLLCVALSASGSWAEPETQRRPVTVCFAEGEANAYAYKDARGQWRGAALDLTRAALARAGFDVTLKPLPWARCLREVAEYKDRRGFEIASYASYSDERAQQYLITLPLHRITSGVWISRRQTPAAAPIQTLEELARHRLCGLHGSNFSWLRALGVTQIDTGALNQGSLLRKLERGHCEWVVWAKEPVLGAAQLGLLNLPPHLDFLPLPGPRMIGQRLLVARTSPRATQLQQGIDRALTEMHRSGASQRLYKRYLPTGTSLGAGIDEADASTPP